MAAAAGTAADERLGGRLLAKLKSPGRMAAPGDTALAPASPGRRDGTAGPRMDAAGPHHQCLSLSEVRRRRRPGARRSACQ